MRKASPENALLMPSQYFSSTSLIEIEMHLDMEEGMAMTLLW